MRIYLKIRGLLWSLQLWLLRRKPVCQILKSGIDDEGRWFLTARIDDDRIWRAIKGEYRPWTLRVTNFFRWLFGRPQKPYPRWSGFSVKGNAEVSDESNGS